MYVGAHEARVDGLVTYYFTESAPYPLDLIIAVPDVSYQPSQTWVLGKASRRRR